jgi:UDP-N-acetylglucosamine diphosphorylase / glucose-1-phosphate thymidylyltransferase / UDP-N-acetylgalactosamine diphosphorylase / glucosamine-1-phosphate N-acetyltransferase / galactosamine-1-phosphate N-acetyltransferase
LAVNIVIPMAGLGSRFHQAGFHTPKPLIPVLGRPMYAWATESLPLSQAGRLIFVLLESQPEFNDLRSDILKRYSRAHPIVLSVPTLTAGQSITVLRTKELINSDEPLLIHNADTAFEIEPSWATDALQTGCDGALLVFRSAEPRWSYSRDDDSGRVIEVKEKVVISPWASTGTYWFRKGSDFVRLAESRWTAGHKEASEYYVGPLYNDLIAQGGRVKNYPIARLFCFGTPEDLAATLKDLERAPQAR